MWLDNKTGRICCYYRRRSCIYRQSESPGDCFHPLSSLPLLLSLDIFDKATEKLYHSIKVSLRNVYGYADLESVFSVLKTILEGAKYSDLGLLRRMQCQKLRLTPKMRSIQVMMSFMQRNY